MLLRTGGTNPSEDGRDVVPVPRIAEMMHCLAVQVGIQVMRRERGRLPGFPGSQNEAARTAGGRERLEWTDFEAQGWASNPNGPERGRELILIAQFGDLEGIQTRRYHSCTYFGVCSDPNVARRVARSA